VNIKRRATEMGADAGGGSLKTTTAPDVSIVIPVYNEEGILSASLSDLRE
jgi:cellulose synthase/poly-beta-1,6-N-acetylglucosamine synthase-like glycosyltransferase